MKLRYVLITAFLFALKGHANTGSGTTYQLDPYQTQVRVHLSKAGLLSFMGDNHLVDVPISGGTLVTGPSNEPQSLEVSIQTNQIKILDPELAEGKRAEVQKKTEGEAVLDVLNYPTIQFTSTNFKKGKDENSWRIPGKITVRDTTASIEITANIELGETEFSAQGQAELKLKKIGIKPPGGAGGTVKVKDAFTVEFETHGTK